MAGPHLRASIQGYNTQADVDQLVDALGRLLPMCRDGSELLAQLPPQCIEGSVPFDPPTSSQ
jgi:hypothetical protein